jgi:hypothetical protein
MWIDKPHQPKPFLCRIGLHFPAEWKTSVEPSMRAVATLVVKRRWCTRCKAMEEVTVSSHL